VTKTLTLPWRAWSEDPEQREFPFPSEWEVERLEMAGWEQPSSPDYSKLIAAVQEQVSARARVSIAIDDLTRPSPLGLALQAIVTGLLDAGVPKSQIDLVMATGAHRRPGADEVRAKIGDWIAERFEVRFHDAAGELSDSGIRIGKIPLRIDGPFLEADFRIGVGSVIPNPFAGFSGGGKIVVLGLASLDTLVWLHKLAMMGFAGGIGATEGNRIRREMERVAEELPLHFGVSCLVDSTRYIREVHFGEPTEAHRLACDSARQAYATPMTGTFDVLFCNAYPKDGEFLQVENAYSPLRTGGLKHLAEGGAVILMAACHRGRGHHGLFDRGMPLHREANAPKPFLGETPLYVYAPGISESDCQVTHWEGYPHFSRWDELVSTLLERFGVDVRAGVFPAASCQLGPPEDS
jgi:hypothetical protein